MLISPNSRPPLQRPGPPPNKLNSPLLVIDVGNSSTSFGLYSLANPKKPLTQWALPTPRLKSLFFGAALRRTLASKKIFPSKLVGASVSSVVPETDRALKRALNSLGVKNVLFISSAVSSRVQNLYKKPSEVGADRLVNARAAMEIHPGASIVVDFGTATTFDCVAKGGKYLGGVIAPGPVISAEALFARTSKLPQVVLDKPAKILGRNTQEAIKSGLYHGYRGLVVEIVEQLKKKMGQQTKVIATGGQARWLLKGLPLVDQYEPYLTLMGLVYYWKDQLKSRRFDHTLEAS